MADSHDRLTSFLQISDSWSVEYSGIPYDDARQVDGIWYYRHFVTREFLPFALPDRVVPLFRNGNATPSALRRQDGASKPSAVDLPSLDTRTSDTRTSAAVT